MVSWKTAEERAWEDSVQVYCNRNMDNHCWESGTVVDLGPGIWLSSMVRDYDCNATELYPDWSTFHAAPDEATALLWATMANLGTRDPDEGDECRSPQ